MIEDLTRTVLPYLFQKTGGGPMCRACGARRGMCWPSCPVGAVESALRGIEIDSDELRADAARLVEENRKLRAELRLAQDILRDSKGGNDDG